MSVFSLTPDRQVELAGLLDNDGADLRARYPRVAEYFGAAEQLAGTGDRAADDAFDIRLLHYMADGDSDNPYWDIVAPSVFVSPERGGRREVNGGSPAGSARLGYAQTVLQAAFAYAIPSPETLCWVERVSEGRPLVEIGAGRGYWAHQLARLGLDVAAFDSHPPSTAGRNTWFPAAAGERDLWYPVGGLRELARARHEARWAGTEGAHVLLLVWPPAWGHPMASRALAAYERAGGDRLVYVGDPAPGGRSGDEAFFERLAAGWELVDQDPEHVAWWSLADVAQCWRRR